MDLKTFPGGTLPYPHSCSAAGLFSGAARLPKLATRRSPSRYHLSDVVFSRWAFRMGTSPVLERPNPTGAVYGRCVSAEDAELVARVQRGESQAYAELVRRYQDRVFNACWRICGHLEDARDLTQEAFLKAFEGLGNFRGESGFFTWIFRVAVNLSLTHRRNTHRRRVLSLDQATNPDGTQADELARRMRHAENDGPADGPTQGELHAAVVRAMHDLDDDQRAVLVLRDIEGFDYEQIGSILRIPPGTVKSRLFRARSAIQRAIDPQMLSHRRKANSDD